MMKEVEINSQRIKVVSTVNAIGWLCPMPVVKLKLGLEKAEINQVIEFLADDPGVLKDVPAWCEETNNKLLFMEKNSEGIFIAYVEKCAD